MRKLFSCVFAVVAVGAFAFPAATFARLAEPDNLTIVGGTFTNDETPTFTWDTVYGATSYDVSLAPDGEVVTIGYTTSYSADWLDDGWYSFSVRAVKSGVASTWASITFEVDTEGPIVPKVLSSVHGKHVSFTVQPRPDEVYTSVASCVLDLSRVADVSMKREGENFTASHTFVRSGEYQVRAECIDSDNNVTFGPWSRFTISSDVVMPEPTPTTMAQPGDRMKTACGAKASAMDVCHAVYYYGDDGKRHIFPDEATYKTWYNTWAGIKTVSSAFLAGIPLGEPVTVHPGTVVVRFQSDDAIYAVSEGGVLRHYVNEYLLKLDYGGLWHQFLRILPDAWFGHYTVGRDINNSGDYDRDRAAAEVRDINDNF